jgi:hypothetical protein
MQCSAVQLAGCGHGGVRTSILQMAECPYFAEMWSGVW